MSSTDSQRSSATHSLPTPLRTIPGLWHGDFFQLLLIHLLMVYFGRFCGFGVFFLVLLSCWVFFPIWNCLKYQFSYCLRGPSEYASSQSQLPILQVIQPSFGYKPKSLCGWVILPFSAPLSEHFPDEKRSLSRRSFHEVSPPSSSLQLGHTAVWCQNQQDAACERALFIF